MADTPRHGPDARRPASARRIAAPLVVAVLVASAGVGLRPAVSATTPAAIPVRSVQLHVAVHGVRTVGLPFAATHVALHWPGAPDALVTVALSVDGHAFGRSTAVDPDEVGDRAGSGETYGNVMLAGGARSVRITSDPPMADLSLVAFDSGVTGPGRLDPGRLDPGAAVSAAVDRPAIISRAAWGADESLRFDSQGVELWPRVFEPIQKIVIHHTAGPNNDPDPAATVRSILRFDAITRDWSDIGYNFLIDQAGRIYEGRASGAYAPGEMPTGENRAGRLVTGAHVLQYNSGVLGIAMLGTYTDRDITPEARAALEGLIAWEAERHGIDPLGSSEYVNPVSGARLTFPNIAGHRDLTATACPGGVFYQTLPALRSAVAARIAARTGPAVDAVAPSVESIEPTSGSPTIGRSVTFGIVFDEPVTGLGADDLLLTGTSPGWAIAGLSGSAAVYDVTLTADAPALGSVGLSLAAGAVADLAGNAGPADPVSSPTLDWVPDLHGTVTRLAGPNRYDTAAAISAATFAPGVPVAYIATGANFPDALAGAVVAAVDGGPVLLVAGGSLPASVATELRRLNPGRIVILGGPSVVSDGLQAELAGYTTGGVKRLFGPDRFATAAAISAAAFPAGVPVAFVATGLNFPDSLAGAAAAGHLGAPLLLVSRDVIPAPTAAELARLRPAKIVILGASGVVSDGLVGILSAYTTEGVFRYAGSNRYDTAAAISAATFPVGVPVAYVATGASFPDALAGAVAAAIDGGPVLLVPGGSLPASVATELGRLAPGRIVILGGPSVVSGGLEAALAAYLGT
jgi:putative cell wall-binding protein